MNRRSFLLSTGLAAAAFAADNFLSPNTEEHTEMNGSQAMAASTHVSPLVLGMGTDSPRLDFGVRHLEEALVATGAMVKRQAVNASSHADVLVLSSETQAAIFPDLVGLRIAEIKPGGYRIFWGKAQRTSTICIVAKDENGAMYGLLDLAEQVRLHGSLAKTQEASVNPHTPFRAIKFNLPWMSYRKGEALQLHTDTCRDLKFWEQFLDMMAENRYNALTLWSLHPFTWMIRPTNFPEACGFDDKELADWQTFWRSLLRMAKDRGIETYLINWNIFVSPEFAKAHHVAEYSVEWGMFGDGDTSELVKRYTRECVTQVINEYPDLTGLGITLGERMGGMTPPEREDWLLATFGEGMKVANRRIKFIHRAPLSANKGSGGSTDNSTAHITRAGIDKLDILGPALVEMKFNWSHAYSSPKLLMIHGGKVSDDYWNPIATDYQITWMLRNEDFFVLRWGDPEFARQLITQNSPEYVVGFFVGSECYIPAKNYQDKPDLPGRAEYGFQRQWLLYMLWGRLLYDLQTPDRVFENAFDMRYGMGVGKPMLAAFASASRMPLHLTTFQGFTWDFTIYAEGFLAPQGGSSANVGVGKDGFLTVDNIIHARPIDPDYVTIGDYVKGVQEKRTFAATQMTPVMLAKRVEDNGHMALQHLRDVSGRAPALAHEVADVKAWAYLSLYFAAKLRAAVALETFRQTGDAKQQADAVALLEQAATQWDGVIAQTKPFHPDVPLLLTGKPFSWEIYRDDVQHDIEIARMAQVAK